jgi:signal transduction histidine kinase
MMNSLNIFQSAVNKLTLWYVGALFIVCLAFSIPVYVISSNRLAHGAVRQAEIIQQFDGRVTISPRVGILREQQLNRDRQQLLHTIILSNLIILSLGAYFSYRFAKRTLKPIEEAHVAQSRFTTDASHELRTPLATMQAEIEVALRDKKFSAKEAKDVLSSNLEEIARLRNLSEQLLGLARLDSGRLQKTNVRLSKITEDEIKTIEKRHGIHIERIVEKDLSVQGDEHLLRQLLNILTDNAVKYAGNQEPKINLELKKKDNGVLLVVTDHGIGIRSSELPHIFDRFYRGSVATKHSLNGHGLGLSLAKQIVDAHDGTIKVASQPGKITTFEIQLPS